MPSARLLATVLCFLSLLCTGVRAQTVDDFSDGNFQNPNWKGDTSDFVVSDGRLRLMAGGAGSSVISVPIGVPATAPVEAFELEFLVDQDFAPSPTNLTVLNIREAVTDPQAARRLRMTFGNQTGNQDFWIINAIDGANGAVTQLDGASGALGQAPATIRFRVTYAAGQGWEFFADYAGGRDFVREGTLLDSFQFSPAELEIECIYTATRADKFSFDDLLAERIDEADEAPPRVVRSQVNSARELELEFDEHPVNTGLLEPENYNLSLPGLRVESADSGGRVLRLRLSEDLPVGEDFTLTIAFVVDETGNEARDLTVPFRYDPVVAATAQNLLVTEFLADPSPVVGLPEHEYIELYNAGDFTVELSDVLIASGTSPAPLSGQLAAGDYLVLTRAEQVSEFQNLGINVLGISFPALTNAGDNISLLRGADTLFSIDYTRAWYNDSERDDGGYSLEFTALEGAAAGCNGRWRASLDASGGTPGRQNSTLNNPADSLGPMIVRTSISTSEINIELSESPQTDQPDFFLELAGMEQAIDEIQRSASGATYRLRFQQPLSPSTIYTLNIPDLTDCTGNTTESTFLELAIPEEPLSGDVVINELLFNPASGGSDFVELYNCSGKVLQINGWVLRNSRSTSANAAQTVGTSRLFFPGEFLTLTADPNHLVETYHNVDSNLLLRQTLPSLPDDEGNLTVIANGTVLDFFDYSEDLHSALLVNKGGISLERLRFKQPGTNANWFSASSTAGFATPTRPNSQVREDLSAEAGNDPFFLLNQTFSPNADGNEDFLEIHYQDTRVGALARIRIYDAQGRRVRVLTPVELLATEGTIIWDGTNDDGRKAKAGAYVIFTELITPDEPVRSQKLVVALAGE